MMQGYLSLVLHAHLPFVRHPEHDKFLEENWLYEAITETYLPLIQIWVMFLKIPYRILFPGICLFCAIGAYSLNNSAMEVYLAAGFGLFGYFASKWGCEPAPLLLGFVLGPLMEENLRRAMLISRGDPSVFFTRPISAGMLIVAIALLVMIVAPQFRKKREEVLTEGDGL